MKTLATANSAVTIYNEAISRVNNLLGKDFTIVAPVSVANQPGTVKAKVNISYLLAGFLTLSRFDDSNENFGLW